MSSKWVNGCRNIAFSVFCQNGGRPTFSIFYSDFWTSLQDQMANLHQCAKFHQNRSKYLWNIAIYPFSRWRPSAVLDLWCKFWNKPKEYLVVFITVPNLVGIASVVLIILKFAYFACLAYRCLFMPLLGCFWGKNSGNINFLHFYPSRNVITLNWRYIQQTM